MRSFRPLRPAAPFCICTQWRTTAAPFMRRCRRVPVWIFRWLPSAVWTGMRTFPRGLHRLFLQRVRRFPAAPALTWRFCLNRSCRRPSRFCRLCRGAALPAIHWRGSLPCMRFIRPACLKTLPVCPVRCGFRVLRRMSFHILFVKNRAASIFHLAIKSAKRTTAICSAYRKTHRLLKRFAAVRA